jgi:RNA polymerase nonessential primary-like sigma factor
MARRSNQYQQSYNHQDSFGHYLREVGRYPLLDKAVQLDLVRKASRMHQIKETRPYPECPIEEWAPRIQLDPKDLNRILNEGEAARTKVIKHNLRLVVNIARQFNNRGVPISDLVQEGNIGLSKALERFEPARGYQFSTYAYWWIKQGISRAITQHSRTVRIPVHIYEKGNAIKKAASAIAQTKGRSPSVQEISDYLTQKNEKKAKKLRPDVIRSVMQHLLKPASLDRTIKQSDDSLVTVVDVLEYEQTNPFDQIDWNEMESKLYSCLAKLTKREQYMLIMRYGLSGLTPMSHKEIGQMSNSEDATLTNEGLRKLEKRALDKLSGFLRLEGVNFIDLTL